MSDSIPIQTPGGFVPVYALGMDDGSGHLARIGRDDPLPVAAAFPAPPAALEGTLNETAVVGPFIPASAAPIVCSLAGDFSGRVRVMRSIDGGATLTGLTVAGAPWAEFTGPACEPVWEEASDGATFWLDCTLASGTLVYRLAQ